MPMIPNNACVCLKQTQNKLLIQNHTEWINLLNCIEFCLDCFSMFVTVKIVLPFEKYNFGIVEKGKHSACIFVYQRIKNGFANEGFPLKMTTKDQSLASLFGIITSLFKRKDAMQCILLKTNRRCEKSPLKTWKICRSLRKPAIKKTVR